jgi:hypothetical protein
MKELRAIIRNYVSDKADIKAGPVFDWFIAQNPELWETYKEECATEGLKRIIKTIFNEHSVPLKDNYSGTQIEFSLKEAQKIIKKIPNLPRHIHIMDAKDGSATYYPWQEATDGMLASDEAFSIKQSEDCIQRAKAIAKLRRFRNSIGVPENVTLAQHWDALSQ